MNKHNPDDIWDMIDATGDCWLWQGWIATTGYGVFNMNDRQYLAHRLVYESLVALIPPGLTIDHLCRTKACVNPDHVELVSHGENARRAARRFYCIHGHPLADGFVRRSGGRNCRQCVLDSTRRRRAVGRAA